MQQEKKINKQKIPEELLNKVQPEEMEYLKVDQKGLQSTVLDTRWSLTKTDFLQSIKSMTLLDSMSN